MLSIEKNYVSLIYNEVKNIIEQIKLNKKIYYEEKEILEKYAKKFPFPDTYFNAVHEAGIIDSRNFVIPMINAKKSEPKCFLFSLSDADSSSLYEKENDSGFFNLIIDPNGRTLFEIFQNGREWLFESFETENFEAERFRFFIDFPYILGKIIQDKNLKKTNKDIKNFIKENPSCTFSNVYNFVSKNLEETNEILYHFHNLEKNADNFVHNRQMAAENSHSIQDYFSVKTANYERGDCYKGVYKYAEYVVEEDEKSEPCIKLDINRIDLKKTIGLSTFPVKVIVNEKEIRPLYLSEDFFNGKKDYYKVLEDGTKTIDSILISYEQKIAEITNNKSMPECNSGCNYQSIEENVTREVNNNFNTLIKCFRRYVKKTNAVEQNSKNQSDLNFLNFAFSSLENESDTIKRFLAKLYKNEIIINRI